MTFKPERLTGRRARKYVELQKRLPPVRPSPQAAAAAKRLKHPERLQSVVRVLTADNLYHTVALIRGHVVLLDHCKAADAVIGLLGGNGYCACHRLRDLWRTATHTHYKAKGAWADMRNEFPEAWRVLRFGCREPVGKYRAGWGYYRRKYPAVEKAGRGRPTWLPLRLSKRLAVSGAADRIADLATGLFHSVLTRWLTGHGATLIAHWPDAYAVRPVVASVTHRDETQSPAYSDSLVLGRRSGDSPVTVGLRIPPYSWYVRAFCRGVAVLPGRYYADDIASPADEYFVTDLSWASYHDGAFARALSLSRLVQGLYSSKGLSTWGVECNGMIKRDELGRWSFRPIAASTSDCIHVPAEWHIDVARWDKPEHKEEDLKHMEY